MQPFFGISKEVFCQTKIEIKELKKGGICMKKIILLIVVLGIITAGWLLYFNNGAPETTVSVNQAKYMDLKNTLEFSGQVVPKTQYSVMSETGGTVDNINVKEGDVVKANDPLFSLETEQVENLLDQAKLNYDMLSQAQTQTVMAQSSGIEEDKAKVALALSQTTGFDYDSFNSAFSDQIADNAAQMTSALNGMDLSEATGNSSDGSSVSDDKLKLAELQVQDLQDKLNGMSYSSMINGTVVSVNIHKGEVLSPGIPAMVIADTDDILIDGYVYVKDLDKLSKGMDVRINTDEGYFAGKIADIAKVAQSTTDSNSNFGTMTKIVITPDKSFNKIPGAEADLEVILNSKDNVLSIPLDCITEDGCVYVVNKDNVIEKRTIETGFTTDFYAEVKSGISEGENVVLSPQNLKEGQKVAYDRS